MNGCLEVRGFAAIAGRGDDADELARALTTLRLGVDLLALMGPGDEQTTDARRLLYLLSETTERLTGHITRLVAQPRIAPA